MKRDQRSGPIGLRVPVTYGEELMRENGGGWGDGISAQELGRAANSSCRTLVGPSWVLVMRQAEANYRSSHHDKTSSWAQRPLAEWGDRFVGDL
jgi:hypothetical protein